MRNNPGPPLDKIWLEDYSFWQRISATRSTAGGSVALMLGRWGSSDQRREKKKNDGELHHASDAVQLEEAVLAKDQEYPGDCE